MTRDARIALNKEELKTMLNNMENPLTYALDDEDAQGAANIMQLALRLQRAAGSGYGVFWPTLPGGHEHDQGMVPSQVTAEYVKELYGWSEA